MGSCDELEPSLAFGGRSSISWPDLWVRTALKLTGTANAAAQRQSRRGQECRGAEWIARNLSGAAWWRVCSISAQLICEAICKARPSFEGSTYARGNCTSNLFASALSSIECSETGAARASRRRRSPEPPLRVNWLRSSLPSCPATMLQTTRRAWRSGLHSPMRARARTQMGRGVSPIPDPPWTARCRGRGVYCCGG